MLLSPPLTLKTVLEGRVNFWATIPGRCLLCESSSAKARLVAGWRGFRWCWDQLQLAPTQQRTASMTTSQKFPKVFSTSIDVLEILKKKNRGFISSRFLDSYTIVTGFRYKFKFSRQHCVFSFENRPVRVVEAMVCGFIGPVVSDVKWNEVWFPSVASRTKAFNFVWSLLIRLWS